MQMARFNCMLFVCFSFSPPIAAYASTTAATSAEAKQQQNVAGGAALPPKLLFEKSCQKIFSFSSAAHVIDMQGGCACAKDWRSVKCCCVGQGVRQIPMDMAGPGRAKSVSTIFFFDVSLSRLTPASFAAFHNLEEIFLDNASVLEHVDSRAFSGLKKLRKISISNCPALVSWTGVLLRENPQIQTLMVLNSGLRELPQLEMGPQHSLPMERIDFSGNCISQIAAGTLHAVQAKTVSFSNNAPCLRAIAANAFPACKFVELHLSSNPSLEHLAEAAFAGLAHIEHLDLSQTRITALPFAGLRSLKQLTLTDVPRLKVLPPVLAFPNLVRAEFTYAHHCCFFKYATRDYYERKGIINGMPNNGGRLSSAGNSQTRELDENFRAIQRRVCRRRHMADDDGSIHAHRSRRHVIAHNAAGDAMLKELTEWYRNIEAASTIKSSPQALSLNEPAPYTNDEIGKSFLLKRCDGTAVDSFYLNLSCSPRPDALNPCEDIVSHLPLRVMIWVMWVGAIFGNLGVWAVICAAWQRKMRLHYVFMLNLSFADFLTGVYLAMLAMADLRTANEYYTFAVEWQTGWGCAVAGFLSVFATELSTFSMLMIATEIYYNSRYAFYGRRFGPISATVALIGGYAYSLLMAALPLFGVSSYEHSSICLPLQIQSSLDRAYILFGLALSALAFLAMIVIYVLLNCMLRRSSAVSSRHFSRERAEEDRQILRRTLVLIGTDMLCWLPTLFFGFTAAMGRPLITLSSAKWCLVLFYPINSCANPLLYVFLTRIWRDAKRKSAAVLRKSLANAGGTLSLNRLELFYATAPNGHRRGSGPAAVALDRLLRRLSAANGQDEDGHDGDDDDEEEEDERNRSNTVHCCGGNEQRMKMMALRRANSSNGSNSNSSKGRRKKRRSSTDDSRANILAERKLSSDSLAFRKSVKPKVPTPYTQLRRKSQPDPLRAKISSPPQMSDISESSTASMCSSVLKSVGGVGAVSATTATAVQQAEAKTKKGGGDGTNGKKMVHKRAKQVTSIEESAVVAAGATRNGTEKRQSNASSAADGDSGRGDSLRSWASRQSGRPSVVTMCWEQPRDGTKQSQHQLLLRLATTQPS